MKQLFILFCASLLTIVWQSGCTNLESGTSIEVSKSAPWAILPLQNLAETPRAGERVESMLLSLLQNQGVNPLMSYPKGDANDLALFIDDGKRLAAAQIWARESGWRYGVTGSIQEWRYKTGLDGEPAVGITLSLIDLQSDALIWTATASRTGWGSENLTTTTTKVLKTLLAELDLIP